MLQRAEDGQGPLDAQHHHTETAHVDAAAGHPAGCCADKEIQCPSLEGIGQGAEQVKGVGHQQNENILVGIVLLEVKNCFTKWGGSKVTLMRPAHKMLVKVTKLATRPISI